MRWRNRCTFASAALMAVVALSTPALAQAKSWFDLPAQPLADSLRTVASKNNLNLLFDPPLVASRAAPPLKGEFTTTQAFTLLLAGTGIYHEFLNERTVVLAPVRASAPTGGRTSSTTTGSPAGPVDSVRTTFHTNAALSEEPSFWSRFRVAQANGQSSSVPEPSADGSPSPEREPAIEEIIVTAQKRQERLQDVPVPVTVLSGEALVSSNQLRLEDYYNRVPGLGISLVGDGSAPSVNIRGVTTGGLTNPTVGIVIDEIPYGTTVVVGTAPSAPDVDPGDLARLEVLRGPQGTLYGASSMGGLLNFVTIEPSVAGVSGRVEGGMTSVSEGDDLGHTVRGSINLPLGDSFAIRASGFTLREPGYVDNVLTGQEDINRRDSEGGRVSALWRFAENFSLKLSAMLQQSERLGTADVDSALSSDEPQRSSVRGSGTYRRDTQAYSATVDGSLGDVEVKSITAYNVDEIGTRIDNSSIFRAIAQNGVPGTGFSGFGVTGTVTPVDRRIEKFTQEVRASIPLGERINWLLGAFYTDEDVAGEQVVLASDPPSGAVAGTLLFQRFPNTFKEYAAFTNVGIQLTERFDIQLGARVSENELTFSTTRGGALVDSSILFGGVTLVPEVNGEDDAFTYLLTPRLRITPDMMVYARLASGYRPGGANVACGTPGIPCQYEADTTQNYEIGMKGSAFGGALSYDASLYRIDWKDIQVSLSLSGQGFQDNGPQAKSQGVELSLMTKPLKGLRLSAWGTYNDAELVDPFPSISTVRGAAGDRLPFSSRVSGNLSLDHEFPFASSRATALWGSSVTYVGDRKGVFRSVVLRDTYPSYTQIDLYAGVRYDSWTARAFVNNVGDKRGVLRAGLDQLSPTLVTYIEPRTIGLSLSKAF